MNLATVHALRQSRTSDLEVGDDALMRRLADGDVSALGVIVDDDVRRERIRSMAGRAAQKRGLMLKEDAGLIDEISFMLEDPRLIVGEFSKRYLSLPPEVVTTAMRSHQRYLALTDAAGPLMPMFITVTDGPVKAPAVVRSGNEKVLRARPGSREPI